MEIITVNGPIGSGKSTIISQFLKQPGYENIEFISSDIYYLKYFKDYYDRDYAYLLADKYLYYKAQHLLENGIPFAIELVLSTPKKLRFLEDCKYKYGYKITGIFTGTAEPSIDRVNKRNEQGGITVSSQKIIDRYEKSMHTLKNLYNFSDKLYVFDNSRARPILAAYKELDELYINFHNIEWLNEFLIRI